MDLDTGKRRIDFEVRCNAKTLSCPHCGTAQVGVPWAREGSGFTALFEALALSLCRELPVRQAAAMLRCADKRLLFATEGRDHQTEVDAAAVEHNDSRP